MSRISLFHRVMSALLMVCFLTTQHMSGSAFASMPASPESLPAFADQHRSIEIGHLEIPAELGRVQEIYLGKTKKTVVLIQDAHAIPDAQKNIQSLIEYFEQQFGLNLVAFEGAASEMDPQFFRSFPDTEKLKEILKEYQLRGELTATTSAALLSDIPTTFVGVEDWNLYEKGLGFYLEAMGGKDLLSAELKKVEESLTTRKKEIYSKGAFQLDAKMESFYQNQSDFLSLLQDLAVIQRPAQGSSLAALLLESHLTEKGNIPQKVESEIKTKAQALRHAITQDGNSQALKKINESFQRYQTSQMTPQAFAHYLEETAKAVQFQLSFSDQIQPFLNNQRTLKQIEGTALFEELETYIGAVKEALFKDNSEALKLNLMSGQVRLLQKLAKLELSQSDWVKLRVEELDLQLQEFLSVMKPHFNFYQNAEERDKSMAKNLLEKMGEAATQPKNCSEPKTCESSDLALMIAGGFHAQGMTEALRAADVSYALLIPLIEHLPESSSYENQMKGNVPWREYAEVKNDRVNLYEPFLRAMRDQLLGRSSKDGKKDFADRNPQLLKTWRDQLLRDLSAQGRLAEASQYTRYLDEIAAESKSEKDLKQEWLSNVDRFTEKLEELKVRGQLNEQSILKLLNVPSNMPAAAPTNGLVHNASLSAQLWQGSGAKSYSQKALVLKRSGTLAASETRQPPREDEIKPEESENPANQVESASSKSHASKGWSFIGRRVIALMLASALLIMTMLFMMKKYVDFQIEGGILQPDQQTLEMRTIQLPLLNRMAQGKLILNILDTTRRENQRLHEAKILSRFNVIGQEAIQILLDEAKKESIKATDLGILFATLRQLIDFGHITHGDENHKLFKQILKEHLQSSDFDRRRVAVIGLIHMLDIKEYRLIVQEELGKAKQISEEELKKTKLVVIEGLSLRSHRTPESANDLIPFLHEDDSEVRAAATKLVGTILRENYDASYDPKVPFASKSPFGKVHSNVASIFIEIIKSEGKNPTEAGQSVLFPIIDYLDQTRSLPEGLKSLTNPTAPSPSRSEARDDQGKSKKMGRRARLKDEAATEMSRRQFLAKIVGGAAAVAVVSAGGWLVWDNVREKEPWEEFEEERLRDPKTRFDAVKNAILTTLDWMIAEGHPNPSVLKNYRDAVAKNSIELPKGEWAWLSKNPKTKIVKINSNLLHLFLLTIQQQGSKDLFIEWAVVLEREAHGFNVMNTWDSLLDAENFNQRAEVLLELQKKIIGIDISWPDEKTTRFLNEKGVEDEIVELTALALSGEVYETFREYQAFQRLIENNSYSPKQAQADYAKAQVSPNFGARVEELLKTEGKLEAIIFAQLETLSRGAIKHDSITKADLLYIYLTLLNSERTKLKTLRPAARRIEANVREALKKIDDKMPDDEKILPLLDSKSPRSEARAEGDDVAKVPPATPELSPEEKEALALELAKPKKSRRFLVKWGFALFAGISIAVMVYLLVGIVHVDHQISVLIGTRPGNNVQAAKNLQSVQWVPASLVVDQQAPRSEAREILQPAVSVRSELRNGNSLFAEINLNVIGTWVSEHPILTVLGALGVLGLTASILIYRKFRPNKNTQKSKTRQGFDWKIFANILSESDKKQLEELLLSLPAADRQKMVEDIQDAYQYFEHRAPYEKGHYPPDAPQEMIRWIISLTSEGKTLLRQLFLQLQSREGAGFQGDLAKASLLPETERMEFLRKEIETSRKDAQEEERWTQLLTVERSDGTKIHYSLYSNIEEPTIQSDIFAFADDVVLALADRGITAWKLEFLNHAPWFFSPEGWSKFMLRIEDNQGRKKYFWRNVPYEQIQQNSPIRLLLLEMIREGFENMVSGFEVGLSIDERKYNLSDQANMEFFLKNALTKKKRYDKDHNVKSTARIFGKNLEIVDFPFSHGVGLVIEDKDGEPMLYSAFDIATERFTDFKPVTVRSEMRVRWVPAPLVLTTPEVRSETRGKAESLRSRIRSKIRNVVRNISAKDFQPFRDDEAARNVINQFESAIRSQPTLSKHFSTAYFTSMHDHKNVEGAGSYHLSNFNDSVLVVDNLPTNPLGSQGLLLFRLNSEKQPSVLGTFVGYLIYGVRTDQTIDIAFDVFPEFRARTKASLGVPGNSNVRASELLWHALGVLNRKEEPSSFTIQSEYQIKDTAVGERVKSAIFYLKNGFYPVEYKEMADVLVAKLKDGEQLNETEVRDFLNIVEPQEEGPRNKHGERDGKVRQWRLDMNPPKDLEFPLQPVASSFSVAKSPRSETRGEIAAETEGTFSDEQSKKLEQMKALLFDENLGDLDRLVRDVARRELRRYETSLEVDDVSQEILFEFWKDKEKIVKRYEGHLKDSLEKRKIAIHPKKFISHRAVWRVKRLLTQDFSIRSLRRTFKYEWLGNVPGAVPSPIYERLHGELDRLIPIQRQTLELHYLDGLTDKKVSQATGLSLSMTKHHISDGLAAMRVFLKDLHPDKKPTTFSARSESREVNFQKIEAQLLKVLEALAGNRVEEAEYLLNAANRELNPLNTKRGIYQRKFDELAVAEKDLRKLLGAEKTISSYFETLRKSTRGTSQHHFKVYLQGSLQSIAGYLDEYIQSELPKGLQQAFREIVYRQKSKLTHLLDQAQAKELDVEVRFPKISQRLLGPLDVDFRDQPKMKLDQFEVDDWEGVRDSISLIFQKFPDVLISEVIFFDDHGQQIESHNIKNDGSPSFEDPVDELVRALMTEVENLPVQFHSALMPRTVIFDVRQKAAEQTIQLKIVLAEARSEARGKKVEKSEKVDEVQIKFYANPKRKRLSRNQTLDPAQKVLFEPVLLNLFKKEQAAHWTGFVRNALVAYKGDALLGVQAFAIDRDVAYAEGLKVVEAARRQHLGLHLRQKLLNYLKANEVRFLVVPFDNTEESKAFHIAWMKSLEEAVFRKEIPLPGERKLGRITIDLMKFNQIRGRAGLGSRPIKRSRVVGLQGAKRSEIRNKTNFVNVVYPIALGLYPEQREKVVSRSELRRAATAVAQSEISIPELKVILRKAVEQAADEVLKESKASSEDPVYLKMLTQVLEARHDKALAFIEKIFKDQKGNITLALSLPENFNPMQAEKSHLQEASKDYQKIFTDDFAAFFKARLERMLLRGDGAIELSRPLRQQGIRISSERNLERIARLGLNRQTYLPDLRSFQISPISSEASIVPIGFEFDEGVSPLARREARLTQVLYGIAIALLSQESDDFKTIKDNLLKALLLLDVGEYPQELIQNVIRSDLNGNLFVSSAAVQALLDFEARTLMSRSA